MAQSNCFICPGHAAIFVADPDDGNDIVSTDWFKLPHTVTWELAPDIEDPTEIRTSDTAGNKVAVGAGATSYTLNVTSALAEEDWLYLYILDDDATWGRTQLGSGADLWFFLAWDEDDTPGTTIVYNEGTSSYDYPTNNDNGIYLRGQVQPGGYGLDNDSTDPAQAEWTANVTWGPHLPDPTSGADLGTTGTDPALNPV